MFAGRLSPEKGVHTLLETLHIDIIEQDADLTFTATTAGADRPQGRIIERLLGHHPEARHAGCWVIASDDRGLPETDCGGVVLIAPDNAEALALGIREVIAGRPFTAASRQDAGTRFTVAQSVDSLLAVLARPQAIPPAVNIKQLEELVRAPSAERPHAIKPIAAVQERAGSALLDIM
ncbi:glycosyltransferase [Actinokineospora cianjurensis]|uniref:Uncharacterized protein n=1 Tax=Actinokineospora cianjurensis TaxID=585224 RepID=A0A421B2N3_9PSEU|nr:hypothetical protein [Actinokineospora cianjurensis]RLK58614.1 hypothetical protein CLV68_3085 [Actinokineospora cianjurensis]